MSCLFLSSREMTAICQCWLIYFNIPTVQISEVLSILVIFSCPSPLDISLIWFFQKIFRERRLVLMSESILFLRMYITSVKMQFKVVYSNPFNNVGLSLILITAVKLIAITLQVTVLKFQLLYIFLQFFCYYPNSSICEV